MKPRVAVEGVASDSTSEDFTCPNMTQDEPERVKEIRQRQYDRRKLAEDRGADVGNNKLYGDIDALLSIISDSEKRAEEMEADRDEEREARRELDRALDRVLKQRDDAIALGLSLKLALGVMQSERDSSQASLLRVVEALTRCAERFKEYGIAHMAKQPPDIDKAKRNYEMFDLCRTALSPHKET